MIPAVVSWGLLLTGVVPFFWAWRANQGTTLVHALGWALAAWALWTAVLGVSVFWPDRDTLPVRYLALCLSGCAGVAVLGARRPGVGAWDFVVLGLLAVLLLPLAEGWGYPRLSGLYALFLGSTLAVGIINYLPTRLGPVALILALACALEFAGVLPGGWAPAWVRRAQPLGDLLLACCPWLAWAQFWRRPLPPAEFDRLWLAFRDRYGLVWGQRVREQFNRAAANAGWPVHLRWGGLRLSPGATLPEPAVQNEILAALHALLKRFGPAEK